MSGKKRPGTSVDSLDRTRIADQISSALRRDILRGTLAGGTRLPTERELSRRYGVSSPTVREAVRALSTLGLVEVRHGSGAYVTADTALLVSMALGATIQLQNLGAADVLGVLGALNRQAASEAVDHATDGDHDRLRAAVARIDEANTLDALAGSIREFHRAVLACSHNPLLSALCGFLTEIQVEFAIELTDGSLETWHNLLGRVRSARTEFVGALLARNRANATKASDVFHRTTVEIVLSLPAAEKVRVKDPRFRNLIASMMVRFDEAGRK